MDDASSESALAEPAVRTCIHCHRPIVSESFNPRWRGFCPECIRRLTRSQHPESA